MGSAGRSAQQRWSFARWKQARARASRQLVEQHVIRRAAPRFAPLDAAAFTAKNRYNAALYLVRQAFIFENRSLGDEDVYHQMKGHDAYRALPTKGAQQVLRLLDNNWQRYFAAYAAVASGVDPLAALTSNKQGFVPRLVNGRPIKSTNHYYT